MAIFTRKEITAIEQKPLFRTVDSKKNVLTTDGFYIIARKESTEIQIDKQNYTNGVGAYNPLFQDGDIVYVYPTNYFGVNCPGGDVELADTLKTQEVIMTKQKQFVASKLPQRS